MFNFDNDDTLVSSLESAIPYSMFYRRHGILRAVQLVAPPLSKLDTLELPRDSILHYLAEDESQYGIAQDDPVLRGQTRLIMVEHQTQLGDDKGPPRPTQVMANSIILRYHKTNRQTRRMVRPELSMRDSRTLVVENYSLLSHLYRYANSLYASYYKWWNIQARVWKTVAAYAASTQRQQYLVCTIPQTLPTLSTLRRGEQGVNRPVLERLRDDNSWLILEIWKWLGASRAESVLSNATPDQLKRMNLIWIDSGRWFVVNLGDLDAWRKPTKLELEAGVVDHGKIPADALQKRFLKMLMILTETRTVEQSPVLETEPTVDGGGTNDPITVEEEPAVKAPPLSVRVVDEEGKSRTIKLTSNLDINKLPEAPLEETEENIQIIDDAITGDLDALDKLFEDRHRQNAAQAQVGEDAVEEDRAVQDPDLLGNATIKYSPVERTLEKSMLEKIDALADASLLSGAEYRRLIALTGAYKNIPNPYGTGTIAEHAIVTPEELTLSHEPQIPDSPVILDKSMLSSTLFEFDSKYIDQVMSKDVISMLLNLQHSGVAVTGYTVELREDAMNRFEEHRVQLTPVRGKASTLEFRLPSVNRDGTFRTNGVRYRLRKQRSDVPIRKVSPAKVALTSYYSKVFVTRSEKQINNYPGWLTNQIQLRGQAPDDLSVTELMATAVFDSAVRTPRVYSILADRFRSFRVGEYEFFFDYHARHAQFGEAQVKRAEGSGLVVVGRRGRTLLVMDYNNMIYAAQGDDLPIVGTMESLLGLSGRGPLERAEIKVFNKAIPAGVFLGYQLGLTQLIELLGVKVRRVPSGERLHLSDDEYALRFEDEALIFPQDNKAATLILSGFLAFEKAIRNYPSHLFDRKDIYLNILEHGKIGMRYLREMDLMVDLFVDPITAEILKEMNEPTDFIGLVFRSCELLETDWAPEETDMAYMRIRGYERMAGTVYGEMIKSIRMHRARGSVANAKIELAPFAVWQSIHQDPAVKVVEESNPVHNLKEMEEVTYTGTGGRSDRSMVRRTRVFLPSDKAVISEATKDSAAVGITTFLTADPNLTGLRGLTSRYKAGETGNASMLSTTALLSAGIDRDDPKRANFASIQQSSGTFAEGYVPSPLRTGYEQILAHRTDDMFAHTAKKPGRVTAVTDHAITVEYDAGGSESFQLGTRYGMVASLTLPQTLVTTLQVGDTFNVGDLVLYNKNYFEPDPLNPKAAVWKAGVLVKTAILESTDTLEDSSALSERTARLMATRATSIRNLTVTFDQVIHDLVKVGDEVDVESILCTIEDALTAQSELFDSESRDVLRLLAANTPRSKVKGRVERIEVFYHGDIDEMSESLQTLALASDRQRRRVARDLNRSYTSGRVDDSLRIEGSPLLLDTAVIRVYITETIANGVGDKGVFGNQLKTIFGRIMSGVNETESGTPIDAIFGAMSISNRIVSSPDIQGTTNTLLMKISKNAADVYFGS